MLLQVPPAWLKAYPSLKALGPWTRDLLQRLDQLRRWIDKGYPICYWLAGFTYPTAFLTAVLQVCFPSLFESQLGSSYDRCVSNVT